MNMARSFYEVKDSVVGVAGLGGLGSNVAVALTRLGVGKLIIADLDEVELSNLNRQQYTLEQVGQHKVDAMVEKLKKMNHLNVDIVAHKLRLTPENIPDIFAGANVVAECFDRASEKQMLVETVLTKMHNTVVVAASGLAGYGRSNEIKTVRINKRLVMVGDGTSAVGPGFGLTAPRVGLVAYQQANAVAEILIDEQCRLPVRKKNDM